MSETLRLVRRIAAPRATVYRALIDPKAVQQWQVPDNMTSEVHQFEPRIGGNFRISLTYNDPTDTGKTSAHTDTFHGTFTELELDTKVVESIEIETNDPGMQGISTITYRLADAPGGTELVAEHADLPSAISPMDNETGWALSLGKLARLCERS